MNRYVYGGIEKEEKEEVGIGSRMKVRSGMGRSFLNQRKRDKEEVKRDNEELKRASGSHLCWRVVKSSSITMVFAPEHTHIQRNTGTHICQNGVRKR